MAPLAPLSTPVVARKKKEQYLLDVQSSTDKKLAKTQDRYTLQNEKHYCQYRMLRLVVTNWIARKRTLFVEAL